MSEACELPQTLKSGVNVVQTEQGMHLLTAVPNLWQRSLHIRTPTSGGGTLEELGRRLQQ